MNLLAAAIAICLPLAATALNCSCSPTSYTFQLNFSATCDTSTIIEGNPGIVDTGCGIINPDFTTPTNITSGRFVEWDVSNNIITNNFTSFAPPITDGGIVSFTSISDTLNTSKPLADQMELVPRKVELDIFGADSNGVEVANFVLWVYNTTNCNVEPLAVGDTIGWLTLVNYTLPKAAFCAAVLTDSPTAAPTAPPSKEPTDSPISPTATPTAPPSKKPTDSPISPTAAPTVISSKGSKSEGPSAKSAKMAKIEDEIYTEAQKMSSKSHTEMMTKKNFKVVESIDKSLGKDHHNIIMEEDASMSMIVALSFNLMEDDSMSYKARVPSTHVEKSPFGRRNGLRSHEE